MGLTGNPSRHSDPLLFLQVLRLAVPTPRDGHDLLSLVYHHAVTEAKMQDQASWLVGT